MAKFQSPLLGYNNNVRYQGRVFHIQTEDSGVQHPHIITHLFMDGGRILKSVKKSYAEHVASDGMSETVKVMMKDQHKAMLVALKEGQFDSLLDLPKKSSGTVNATNSGRLPDAAPSSGRPPDVAVAVSAPPAPSSPIVSVAAPREPGATPPARPGIIPRKTEQGLAAAFMPAAALPAQKASPTPFVKVSTDGAIPKPPVPMVDTRLPTDDLPPELEALLREDPPPKPAAKPATPVSVPPEPKRPPSVRELTLDFDALERDAGENRLFQPQSDLPPPPKNLFTKEPRTAPYRAVEDGVSSMATTNRVERSPSRFPPPARTPTSRPRPASSPPPADTRSGRTAAATTAQQQPASLFSDDLVSDKSLDEVILSYLADDLETPRRK